MGNRGFFNFQNLKLKNIVIWLLIVGSILWLLIPRIPTVDTQQERETPKTVSFTSCTRCNGVYIPDFKERRMTSMQAKKFCAEICDAAQILKNKQLKEQFPEAWSDEYTPPQRLNPPS